MDLIEMGSLKEKLGNVNAMTVKYEYYKRNLLDFVNDLVKIEDKDNPEGVVIPFNLWDEQEEAIKKMRDNRHLICLKSRQVGISWLALSYIVSRLLFFPGKTAASISQTEGDSKELVRRFTFILRHLPNWLVVDCKAEDDELAENYTGIVYESYSRNVNIIFPGDENESSIFKGHTSSPGAARSFTDNIVLLDEWAFHPQADDIWTAAYPTINRPTGGQVIGVSTGERNTFFEEKWNDAHWEHSGESGSGSNSFVGIFLPWTVDPRRDEEWYETTKREMINFRSEYPSVPSEAFTTGEAAFFTNFDRKIHVPYGKDYYPPTSWRRVAAYDGGYRRACFKWYAISPDNWIICYREYYPADTIDPIQAEKIRSMSRDTQGVPEKLDYVVADTSCWVKSQDTGKSTAEIFEDHGVGPMRQADKSRAQGWRRLHEFLSPIIDEEGEIVLDRHGKELAKLRYTENCTNTLRLFPSMKSAKHDPEDLAHGQEDHVFDTDRYLVMSRPRRNRTDYEKKKARARHRKRTQVINKSVGY